jgi:hypothetical protein
MPCCKSIKDCLKARLKTVRVRHENMEGELIEVSVYEQKDEFLRKVVLINTVVSEIQEI